MKNQILEAIEEQLNKFYANLPSESSISAATLLSHIDLNPLFEHIKIRKTFYSMDSFLKLYLFKKLHGTKSFYITLKELIQNPKEASLLGFFNDDNQLVLPSPRNVNKFFHRRVNGEIMLILDIILELILKKATEKKILLDIPLIQRHIKKKRKDHKEIMKKATSIIKKLVYPHIDIPMRHNAKFTTKDLLDTFVHVCSMNDFCNNGSATFKELNPGREVPHGNTMMYRFNKLKTNAEIREMFTTIFDVIFHFAKKNYILLRRRKLDIAVDVHNIPYYGDKNDSFARGGKPDRGTNYSMQFITCCIVVAGSRFTIDAIPILPLDNPNTLLQTLLTRVKQKINIGYCYLDRGFANSICINTLKRHNIKYVMPLARNSKVKELMDKLEDCPAKVIEGYAIGPNHNKAYTRLVLVNDEEGIKRCFVTNIRIGEQIAHYLYTLYSGRWGIETSYRNMDKDFKPRTTSKNYYIRLFYFLFSVCMYNLWVLVNLVVSLEVFSRAPKTPIITAKKFCIILYKVQMEENPG